MIPSEIEPLIKALTPIKAYLPDIVLVGGWVPLLNSFYNSLYVYEGLPIMTKDVDFVCPHSLAVKEKDVDDLLIKAGFESQLSGDNIPPVCKYVKKETIEIEFLTPMMGEGIERNINVQKKLSAQSLRYLEILLDHTIFIEISETDIKVKTPELAAFIYQKGLSFPSRTSEMKRAKDLYYIYQILDSIADADNLIQDLKEKIMPLHPQRWLYRFTENLKQQFKDIDDIGVDSVTRQIKKLSEYSGDYAIEKRRVFRVFSDFIDCLKST